MCFSYRAAMSLSSSSIRPWLRDASLFSVENQGHPGYVHQRVPTFFGTLPASPGAEAATVVVIVVAFLGTSLANLRANLADFFGESRFPAQQRRTAPTN